MTQITSNKVTDENDKSHCEEVAEVADEETVKKPLVKSSAIEKKIQMSSIMALALEGGKADEDDCFHDEVGKGTIKISPDKPYAFTQSAAKENATTGSSLVAPGAY